MQQFDTPLQPIHSQLRQKHWVLAAVAAAALSACGGGSGTSSGGASSAGPSSTSSATDSSTGSSTVLSIEAGALPSVDANLTVEPLYHLAPVVLAAPDDEDAQSNAASSAVSPRRQALPQVMAGISTGRLTVQSIESNQRARALSVDRSAPLAATTAISTYSPAQIRAAYGLPTLPALGSTPTAAQAAQLGAGQTIYIVDAKHDPNVAAELDAFNQKFGLPACNSVSIASNTSLPLPAASTASGCLLSVVYTTTSGAMTDTAPAYDASWATEIALDVQWAHATAPLARIVLIEAPDTSINSLLGAIKLANAMGPGVVSMSFGGQEGNWTASVDSAFATPGMSYAAATGDAGSQVSWPAVSPNVLGVGGTSLTYGGTGSVRSEMAWSKTGGGISLYTATPSYQASGVPGVGSLGHRAVADVSFNADPSTGQFVAVIAQGTSTVKWVSAGGTSLATPQWAGLTAVANAMRLQAGMAVLGAPHSVLYSQIAAVPGSYASAFSDISTGSNGTCATCSAQLGYDTPTGLGTPNATSLLALLTGTAVSTPPTAPVPTAPTVSSGDVSGKVGTPLSFTVSVSPAKADTFALSGAPAGMTVSSSGVVSWPTPVAGTYKVTVAATDPSTGLTGQGLYTVTITAASTGAPTAGAPVITVPPSLSGTAGQPLIGSIGVADPANRAMSVTISGAPAGMRFSSTGRTVVLLWVNPVAGSYTIGIKVTNSAGVSSQASLPITIAAQ